MQKRVMLLALLALSLFLASCSFKPEAGETPLETEAAVRAAATGTQGLEIRFLPEYPPNIVYDTTELVALVEIWNKGGFDLDSSSCFLELTGYDSNIIKGVFSRQSCSLGSDLEGKKSYNLGGSFNQIEFQSSNIMLPFGVPEYNPNLNLVACYHYQTSANPVVCVENSLHQVTSEQKSCLVKDIGLAGGQAAPVGVSYVDAEMAGNKAVFAITVQNFNSLGRVLSPYSSLASCPNNLEYSDFDKVSYSVELSGGSLIDCKPFDGLVRLTNNQGKIICTFDIGNTPSYETPLMIRLDYNYMESVKKPVKIIKTPGFE